VSAETKITCWERGKRTNGKRTRNQKRRNEEETKKEKKKMREAFSLHRSNERTSLTILTATLLEAAASVAPFSHVGRCERRAGGQLPRAPPRALRDDYS